MYTVENNKDDYNGNGKYGNVTQLKVLEEIRWLE